MQIVCILFKAIQRCIKQNFPKKNVFKLFVYWAIFCIWILMGGKSLEIFLYLAICILYVFLFPSDHPIHPPKSNNDPWDCEFLPDLDEYVIKPVKGVFQVYRNTADAEANRMAEGYEYPDLESYVTDMHLMCALIAGEYSSFIIVLYKFFSNFYTWSSS